MVQKVYFSAIKVIFLLRKEAIEVGVSFLKKLNGMGITFKLYALNHRPAVGSSAYGELIQIRWMPLFLRVDV